MDFFKIVQVKAKHTIAVGKVGFAIKLEVVPVTVEDQNKINLLQNEAMKAQCLKITQKISFSNFKDF